MIRHPSIRELLVAQAMQSRDAGDELLKEAKRILKEDLFSEKKILENLGRYNQNREHPDEETLDKAQIFRPEEIRDLAVKYRLKFLDSKLYKPEIPYEAVLRIKYLNDTFQKDIKHFKVLAHPNAFSTSDLQTETLLFAKTNYDNYYLIHSWGDKIKAGRKIQFWPLRRFETLVITVVLITLVIALSLPTYLITLDAKATYWSGYRIAAFFHLLIFNLGVTAYITFAFGKNFSSSIWNRYKDFD